MDKSLFEINLQYGNKKKPESAAYLVLASNFIDAFKKAENELFIKTGRKQVILNNICTQIMDESYFTTEPIQ